MHAGRRTYFSGTLKSLTLLISLLGGFLNYECIKTMHVSLRWKIYPIYSAWGCSWYDMGIMAADPGAIWVFIHHRRYTSSDYGRLKNNKYQKFINCQLGMW